MTETKYLTNWDALCANIDESTSLPLCYEFVRHILTLVPIRLQGSPFSRD